MTKNVPTLLSSVIFPKIHSKIHTLTYFQNVNTVACALGCPKNRNMPNRFKPVSDWLHCGSVSVLIKVSLELQILSNSAYSWKKTKHFNEINHLGHSAKELRWYCLLFFANQSISYPSVTWLVIWRKIELCLRFLHDWKASSEGFSID